MNRNKTQGTVSVTGLGQSDFTRNNDSQIDGCKVTSGRVRNLKFSKVN
jgi:hypothetical protein